jgi:hypothetical protein
MATGYGVSSTSLNGCVLYFDAANPKSYPGAGTTLFDLSGNGNNGTLTNGPIFSSEKLGCVVFDGTDDYVNVPHNSNYNLGTVFTIIMITSNLSYTGFDNWIIKGSGSGWSNNTGWKAHTGNGSFDLSWYWVFGNGSTHVEIPPFSTWTKSNDTWPFYFMAIQRQADNTFTRYLNGKYETTSYSLSGSVDTSSSLTIGGGSGEGTINGKIASVQIYNRALSQTELGNIFSAFRNRYFGTLPFAPTDISGLKLWLDADDSRTLFADTSGTTKATTDGTAVALWVDKSGNGNNVSQSTASARPAIKSSFTNGRNVLNFDGSNDTLIAPSSTATFKFLHSTGSTVFIVVNYKSPASTYTSYFTTASSTNNVGYLILRYTNDKTGMPYIAGGVGGSWVVVNESDAGYIDNTQFYLVCCACDPTNATAANRATGFKNGRGPFKNNTQTLAASTANSTYDLAIGSEGGIYYANVYIAEILAYNTILTASQRIQVETYLNNKWGLWSSFNPTSISGLQLWLDSSDSGTLFQDSAGVIPAINDGDPVGYWKDKSGNNRNFTQSTAANRPALKTNIQNSKNIIRFDGVNDFIQPSGYALGPQPVTVFTVFKTNGTGYHNIYDTSGSNPMMWIDGSGRIEFDITGYTSSSVVNTATLVSYVNASSGGIIAINGVTATSPYNVALSSSATTFFNRGGGQTYKGDFYEMLIYNSALSTAQRQQVETYLNQKWGVF